MKVRDMTMSDVSAVSELETRCFSKPWSEKMIYHDFAKNSRAHFYVAEDEGELVGYIGIWKVVNNVHITTIAVDPDYRRQGVATALVEQVIGDYATVRQNITLEVRPSNEAARGLYEKLGFSVSGRRKNYYSDNNEDALIMDYDEGRTVSNQSHGHSRHG